MSTAPPVLASKTNALNGRPVRVSTMPGVSPPLGVTVVVAVVVPVPVADGSGTVVPIAGEPAAGRPVRGSIGVGVAVRKPMRGSLGGAAVGSPTRGSVAGAVVGPPALGRRDVGITVGVLPGSLGDEELADGAVVRLGQDLRHEVAAAVEDDVAGAGDRLGQLVRVELRRHHVVAGNDDERGHRDLAE